MNVWKIAYTVFSNQNRNRFIHLICEMTKKGKRVMELFQLEENVHSSAEICW